MPIDEIKISKLGKRYGLHRALASVDLELKSGSVCALLGPNGAGKSTLLGIVSKAIRPSSGKVTFLSGGQVKKNDVSLRREIGVLAHDSFIYSGLSAIENLQFWGRLYGVEDLEEKIEMWLGRVGLEGKAWHRNAGTYSRGMSQRLALARTMLHEPSVLLLDEPFTGLDRNGAAALSESIREAVTRECIVLVITHDLEPIAGLTTDVVVLKRGKMVHKTHTGAHNGSFSFADLKGIYHEHSQ